MGADASPGTLDPALSERLAYTAEEATLILGIGRDLIYNGIRVGHLRSKKAGSRRITPRRIRS